MCHQSVLSHQTSETKVLQHSLLVTTALACVALRCLHHPGLHIGPTRLHCPVSLTSPWPASLTLPGLYRLCRPDCVAYVVTLTVSPMLSPRHASPMIPWPASPMSLWPASLCSPPASHFRTSPPVSHLVAQPLCPSRRASPPASCLIVPHRASPPASRLVAQPCVHLVARHLLCRTSSRLASCIVSRLLCRASSCLASCVAPHHTSPPSSPQPLHQQLLHLGRPAIAGSFECRS